MQNNLFIIAKSGWSYIGYAFLAFVLFSVLDLDLLSFISFVTMFLLVYVFRNPERKMPFFQKNALTAPSDGVITAIEQLEDSEYAYKIDIESSYFNVGILRMPMHAKVDSFKRINGTRIAKNSKLFSRLNEYAEIIFVDNEDNKIKVVHRLKQSFAPINLDLVKNQELAQSSRYGFMTNGITSLYIHSNFRLNVTVGQEIIASETLLGYFS